MKLDWVEYHNHRQLLNKLDQMKVWSNLIGYTPKIGEHILNPLRPDKHKGSCYLENRDGRIIIVDWADRKHSGHDCISAYLMKYPQPWNQACIELLKIGSGISVNTSSYMAIPGYKKKTREIIPIYRNWNDKDKKYWSARGVSRSQLDRKETLTKPIKGYILIKEDTQQFDLNELAYCFESNGRFKLYFPERQEFRFISSTKRTDVWHLDRGSDTLLVTKSQKELLVWENLIDWDLTHVQNESYSEHDAELIYKWEVGYEKVYFNFDNDITGITAMQNFTSKFLFKEAEFFYIDPKFNIKDIDQMRVEWGYNDTLEYINTLI